MDERGFFPLNLLLTTVFQCEGRFSIHSELQEDIAVLV